MTGLDIGTCNVTRWRIGQHGVWDPWQYGATTIRKDNTRRNTQGYNSIADLAQELATFPNINKTEFIPKSSHGQYPGVEVNDRILKQHGTVSDDELGQLGSLIQSIVGRL